MKTVSINLCLRFNGIDKIAGRFIAKVDRRKSSKSVAIRRLPQRTPKRRSPNPYNYKLKWTVTVIMPQIRSKCNKFRKSNLTASPKRCSSEYAIFPERQPYFTYGDIQSSGLKIQATQQTINKCKTCRYSDCFKMCL